VVSILEIENGRRSCELGVEKLGEQYREEKPISLFAKASGEQNLPVLRKKSKTSVRLV